MRKMKKYLLMFLTVLLCITGFSVQISADDEEPEGDQTYTAAYEFKMEDGSEVPESVMELLPEKLTGLKPGDVITNETMKNVETEESVFSFVSWDHDEYVIEDSDVTFIGTWKKTEKSQVEEPIETEAALYPIRFYFVRSGDFTPAEDLPEEIMKLLPETVYVSDYSTESDLDLSEFEATAGYEFKGWVKAGNVSYDGKVEFVSYFGVWGSAISLRTLPGTYPGDGVFDIRIVSSSVENHVPILMADIGPVFCVTPEITGYPLPGTGYKAVGSISSTLANIGWNAYRLAGHYAAQVAVWNHDMSYYDDNYECSGTRYETYHDPDGSAIQDIASFACEFAPKPGKARVRKVVSDSNYDYASYSNNYSLAGAVYGIYTDSACTNLVKTLSTGSNGYTGYWETDNEGTYYIKEITASKGFELDPTVYTARIRKGQTTEITSKEKPYNDPVRIVLIKQNAKYPERVAYLNEAEFTVKYYDTQEDDVSGLSAKKTWVFRPIYNANGEAEILMDSEHFVRGDDLVLNEYGDFYLPLGTFTIEETKAPQTYQRDENIYIGHIKRENGETVTVVNGGDQLVVENLDLTQKECEVIIQTTAIFEENGLHRYFADGVAHIVDVVDYDYLIPGEEYTLKAKLILKAFEEILWTEEDFENGKCTEEQIGTVKERILKEDECEEIMEAEATFVPEAESGQASVKFDGIDFDDKAGNEYVVYEYLYLSSDLENLITYHEDISDEGQTVNIDELYKADFILYKIGDGNRSIKLNGAYFDVKTSRTKRDGRVVEKELGTFVTGGIYLEREEPFKVTVYQDEACTTSVKSYESKWNSHFKKDAVTILDLEEGTYYVKVEGEEEVSVHQIAKGMIFLPMQEEDTQITFTELVAPQGYYLDKKPFVMTVGHDYELLEVENYRSNSMIIIPNTGYDGE